MNISGAFVGFGEGSLLSLSGYASDLWGKLGAKSRSSRGVTSREGHLMRKLAFSASFAALALAGPASAKLIAFDLLKGSDKPIPEG
jgi:hypothetical protein